MEVDKWEGWVPMGNIERNWIWKKKAKEVEGGRQRFRESWKSWQVTTFPSTTEATAPGGRETGSLLHRGSWGLCWGSQGRTVFFRWSRWDTREPDSISEFYLRENGAWGVNEYFQNSNLGGAHTVTWNSHLSQSVQSTREAKKAGKRWLWRQEGLPTGPN